MKCLNRNGINGNVKKKLWVRSRVRFFRVLGSEKVVKLRVPRVLGSVEC